MARICASPVQADAVTNARLAANFQRLRPATVGTAGGLIESASRICNVTSVVLPGELAAGSAEPVASPALVSPVAGAGPGEETGLAAGCGRLVLDDAA